MAEGLSADSQVVSWYLKNDARERAAQLIKFATDGNIAKGLADASATEGKLSDKVRATVQQGLDKVAASNPGTIRDSTPSSQSTSTGVWSRTRATSRRTGWRTSSSAAIPSWRTRSTASFVTTRWSSTACTGSLPDQFSTISGSCRQGPIIGARIIDDRFARELSTRTGAAVAFYAGGERVASGAPEGFDRSQLDMIVNDIKDVENDADYKSKGRSEVRTIAKTLGVEYSRLPGEAWVLGAGFVVGRNTAAFDNPFGFFGAADDKDKSGVPILIVVLAALVAMGVGLAFSFVEHTRPLNVFRDEARRLAKGQTDQLQPSKFRGVYRTIASDVNDGIDVAAGKAGGTRRAADLSQVLGDLPSEPQMSAFSFAAGAEAPAAPKPRPPAPKSSPSHPGAGSPRPPAPQPADEVVTSAPDITAPAVPKRLPAAPPRAAFAAASRARAGFGFGGRRAEPRMGTGLRRLRRGEGALRRVARGFHLRQIPEHAEEAPRRDHRASRREAGEVQRVREGRQGCAQGEPDPRVKRASSRAWVCTGAPRW